MNLQAIWIGFLTLIVTGSRKDNQRIGQSHFIVNRIQQFSDTLVQLIIGILDLPCVFLVHQGAEIAGIIGNRQHIRATACTKSTIVEELLGQTRDLRIDERRSLQIGITIQIALLKCMFERQFI